MVAEATGGAVQIEIYYFGEQPFSGEDLWGATRDRKIEIGDCNTSYVAGMDPVLAMPILPFIIRFGWDQGDEILSTLDPTYEEIMAKRWNMKPIFHFGWPGQTLMTTFPVTDKASLKGKKIRVCSEETGKAATVMGCTPVTMAWGEVYTGLQRGILDGGITSLTGGTIGRWVEPCGYATRWEYIGADSVYMTVNLDAFNELPDDIQAAFMEAMTKFGKKQRAYTFDQYYRAMGRAITEFRCELYPSLLELEAEVYREMLPFYEEYAARDPDYGQYFLDVIAQSNEQWAAK